jgi:hypothetical protein
VSISMFKPKKIAIQLYNQMLNIGNVLIKIRYELAREGDINYGN